MSNAVKIEKGRATYPNGATVRAFRAAGQFFVHKDGPKSLAWAVTAPCGYALGRAYPCRDAAKAAAAAMAPLVVDWTADDLAAIFGDTAVARRACDLARGHFTRNA